MNEPPLSSSAAAGQGDPARAPEPAATTAVVPTARPLIHRWANIWVLGAVALTALCVTSLALVWSTQQRVKTLEQELVRRQQSSQDHATEARLLAQQAKETTADLAARMGLMEARVAESAMQRTQLEELMQSLSRSRDENVVADIDAAVRVALQQSAITGSAEPLMATLRQADERLSRYNQPRLERVRRAVARDLDRARLAQVVDVPTLSIRLDEVVRAVDDLPLVNDPQNSETLVTSGEAASAVSAPPRPAAAVRSNAEAKKTPFHPWMDWLVMQWQQWRGNLWQQAHSLLRVSRIDNPEAVLMAPQQAVFLRENLKLKLLNARLALLSRQFDLARTDLEQARAVLVRYFDMRSRRVASADESLRQLAAQARQVVLPKPDETLSALAAAAAGR